MRFRTSTVSTAVGGKGLAKKYAVIPKQNTTLAIDYMCVSTGPRGSPHFQTTS